ncbi:hypothetical protein [Streptomyces sp. NPDC003077]|uniref:hypothetical protein n=1 Tax=Streptomyces sp. NPDC003077 TaxID=3154443 RepID=UPI0033BEC866
MLLAPADRKPKAVRIHKDLRAHPHRALVLGPVLARVGRPRPSVVHALAGILRDCCVPQARSGPRPMRETGAGVPECLTCATGPDLADWRRVGTALGAVSLEGKKRPDAVAAWVAFAAAKHDGAIIFTSDPSDLQAYLDVLNPPDVHVVSV